MKVPARIFSVQVFHILTNKEKQMKKNESVLVILFAAFIAMTMMLTGCNKKETAKEAPVEDVAGWLTDYDAAKAVAQQYGKKIYILFSGSDWDGKSKEFNEKIGNTDEIIQAMHKDYVLLNIDFADAEFKTAQSDETKLPADQQAAIQALREKITKNRNVASLYNVRAYPCAFVTSSEGYYLSNIAFDDTVQTPAEYVAKVTKDNFELEKFTTLLNKVKHSKKISKVNAIEELYQAEPQEYRALLVDMFREVPKLDKKNKTKLVGKYETEVAYVDSIQFARNHDVDGAINVFLNLIKDGHLTPEQKQNAYYSAAYICSQNVQPDIEKMMGLLQSGIDVAPKGDLVPAMKNVLEECKKIKETEAQGTASESTGANAEAPSGTEKIEK